MIITTLAQLRATSSINISNNIENWLPYISDAEELFITPILGDDVMEFIQNTIQPKKLSEEETVPPVAEEDPGTIDYAQDLLAKVRKAVALYALFLGVDEMAVSISAAGIQVLQSDTHKPAPQSQIMNLKETYLTRAHMQVDSILKFIVKNIGYLSGLALPKAPYLIRDAEQFQVYADIHSSRRVFLSLQPVIGSIEQKYIKYTLSPELFAVIKSEFEAGTLSADNQILYDMIIPALVHLTMARALMEINIDMLDWGIFNNAANTFNSISTKQTANEKRIAVMYEANLRDGEAELKMLQEFLDNSASASKYALYFNSNRYVGPENAEKRFEFINDSTKSIFVA